MLPATPPRQQKPEPIGTKASRAGRKYQHCHTHTACLTHSQAPVVQLRQQQNSVYHFSRAGLIGSEFSPCFRNLSQTHSFNCRRFIFVHISTANFHTFFGMSTLNSLTLAFRDASLEKAFTSHTHARTLLQGRIAIIVGVIVYLLFGLLDQWLVPPKYQTTMWAIRLTALCVPATVFALTFTPWFAPASFLLLASIGLAAGAGLLGMFLLLPLDSLLLYYPGLVLAAFYTYNLVGTRFIHALCVDIALLIGYNILFAVWKGHPLPILATHDFFIISANLIGGGAGYLQELQRRQLFLRELELDSQRKEHLNRSLHDGLTGLANRELLHDRMSQALAHAHREGIGHAVFFIDLDGFKRINDQLGHATGDHALKSVAANLSAAMRDTDTVSRLGGDEFVVLGYGLGSMVDAMKQADKILACVRTPIPGIPEPLSLSASIGVCQFPSEYLHKGTNMADIVADTIRRADDAMFQAKRTGKDRIAAAAGAGTVYHAA